MTWNTRAKYIMGWITHTVVCPLGVAKCRKQAEYSIRKKFRILIIYIVDDYLISLRFIFVIFINFNNWPALYKNLNYMLKIYRKETKNGDY